MHFGELTDVEQRVLGCLIEKRWTTPDQYPLSLNALRLACNQSTNRDPVTAYDEGQVRDAAQRLSKYGLARLASGAGSRATKYRHLAEEGLGLDREQLALLCVLLLRGPQTPGELKMRSDRMAHFETLADVERVLGELGGKGFAQRLGRRPGQKEDRFRQLLGGDRSAASAATPGRSRWAASTSPSPPVSAGEVSVGDASVRGVARARSRSAATTSRRAGARSPSMTTARSRPASRRSRPRWPTSRPSWPTCSSRPAARRRLRTSASGRARVDDGDGGRLAQAMRDEIAVMYEGLDLDGDTMPRAGAAELSPPGGAFVVGYHDGVPVCCGGVKRLDDERCEIKKMYVVPELRGRGVARALLRELEETARGLGYPIARLDTGPKQGNAEGLYRDEGYVEVPDFNGNPVAVFWGEKPL